MDILVKKEIAVEAYQYTMDKELAYTKAQLTQSEIEEVERDQEFQDRLKYFLILKREELTQEFWSLLKSPDEKIKLAAIKELGPLVYPVFFNRNKDNTKPITPEEVMEFYKNELEQL